MTNLVCFLELVVWMHWFVNTFLDPVAANDLQRVLWEATIKFNNFYKIGKLLIFV